MSPTRSWGPLLGGELAERAHRAVNAIAGGLPGLVSDRDARVKAGGFASPGLGGTAAEALFWAYFGDCRDDGEAVNRALESFDRATDELAAGVTAPSLYGGFAGTAWLSELLEGWVYESEGDEDLNEDIDAAILTLLDHRPWTEDYDLISGLAGLGIYAAERLPRPGGVHCLAKIVEHLDELAVERPEGISWFTAPELLPDLQREKFPRGYFNLGLAHGVPAVAVVLATAVRSDVEADRAHRLLEGAMSWILAMRFDHDAQFPAMIGHDGARPAEPPATRLAWCYGDAGVAAALFSAARAVERPDWEAEALAIARRAAGRDPETAGVRDVGICHGSAGLGHIFNRIYQATGDETLGDAARFWFRHTLDWNPEGPWRTGFPSLEPKRLAADTELELREVTGLLTGVSGVGLALLAASGDRVPDWDRVLMVEAPSGS